MTIAKVENVSVVPVAALQVVVTLAANNAIISVTSPYGVVATIGIDDVILVTEAAYAISGCCTECRARLLFDVCDIPRCTIRKLNKFDFITVLTNILGVPPATASISAEILFYNQFVVRANNAQFEIIATSSN
ncbi:hypothetical protein D3C72_1217010 [compost metagenome]